MLVGFWIGLIGPVVIGGFTGEHFYPVRGFLGRKNRSPVSVEIYRVTEVFQGRRLYELAWNGSMILVSADKFKLPDLEVGLALGAKIQCRDTNLIRSYDVSVDYDVGALGDYPGRSVKESNAQLLGKGRPRCNTQDYPD